jgi:hypothetical protein
VSNSTGRRARVRGRQAGPFNRRHRPWPKGIRWVGLDAARVRVDEGRVRMSIVMGLDQHRAHITAEWIDVVSGEIWPRAGATGGPRRGATVPCAVRRPAAGGGFGGDDRLAVLGRGAAGGGGGGASGRAGRDRSTGGNKLRAKSDRADARHHRELLLAGRLPESWIPPDHILDLRAEVRLRHTLIEQHSEWQQRIQAVLYHHGCPQRRQLMIGAIARRAERTPSHRDCNRRQAAATPGSRPPMGLADQNHARRGCLSKTRL